MAVDSRDPKNIEEMLKVRGLLHSVQRLEFPMVNNINYFLKPMGYKIVPIETKEENINTFPNLYRHEM